MFDIFLGGLLGGLFGLVLTSSVFLHIRLGQILEELKRINSAGDQLCGVSNMQSSEKTRQS